MVMWLSGSYSDWLNSFHIITQMVEVMNGYVVEELVHILHG